MEGEAWVLTKAAFVRIPHMDSGIECRLQIAYDEARALTSMTIRYEASLANVQDDIRSVTLLIRPTSIDSCSLSFGTDDKLLPPQLLRFIPSTSVTDAADVVTLTLALKFPAAVLYPTGLTHVRPSDPDNIGFQAFVQVCQSTSVHIHLARAQLGFNNPSRKNDGVRLQRFVDGIHRGFGAKPIDLRRQDGGRGVQEGTWRVMFPPPKYCKAGYSSPAAVLGKRAGPGTEDIFFRVATVLICCAPRTAFLYFALEKNTLYNPSAILSYRSEHSLTGRSSLFPPRSFRSIRPSPAFYYLGRVAKGLYIQHQPVLRLWLTSSPAPSVFRPSRSAS